MQAFSFGQINIPGQRSMFLQSVKQQDMMLIVDSDYVFVDDQNRHKRLKGRSCLNQHYDPPMSDQIQ